LFIKLIENVRNPLLLVVSSSSEIKNRKRISKIGELWRMPVSVKKSSDSSLITLILVVRSSRKLVT
jgi:hypothetical protein